MMWLAIGLLTVALVVYTVLWVRSNERRRLAPPKPPAPTSMLALQPGPGGYTGHVQGLPVQVRYNGYRYDFALAFPPLMYLTPKVRKLSGGAVLGSRTLQTPDTPGLLYVQGQRVHGHAYGQTELVGMLDRTARLLREAEAPMRALLHALEWQEAALQNVSEPGLFGRRGTWQGRALQLQVKHPKAVFRLEHALNLHPQFLLGVGISPTHTSGDAVLDMVLGAQSPEPEQLRALAPHAELLLRCLHANPAWRLHGGHLLMVCEGPLAQVMAQLELGRATLAALEH